MKEENNIKDKDFANILDVQKIMKSVLTEKNIIKFIEESNLIESIIRQPTTEEITEHKRFVGLEKVTVADLEQFVGIYEPNAKIRNKAGLNVKIGDYVPLKGCMEIITELEKILSNVTAKNSFDTHMAYESLHPFTDGNGRSGRALWAWQINRLRGFHPPIFLQLFYYQSLANRPKQQKPSTRSQK